jgi:hypothetical protein
LAIVVAACLVFGAASLIQVGEQEAAQILIGAAMACSGLYYLIMFAVVLWGKLERNERAPWWLRIAACPAAGITVLAVTLQVVPVLDVAHPWQFAFKVGGAVLLMNAAGAWVYFQRRPRANRAIFGVSS